MTKLKKLKIKPNTCPHCGDRLKKIAGVWRCEKDQYNAPFGREIWDETYQSPKERDKPLDGGHVVVKFEE